MTPEANLIQPPQLAVWLINLFASAEEAESILGDLLEEFSHFASESGPAFAGRWYWRQAVRTVVHLAGSGRRGAPWTTLAAIVGGYLLALLVYTLPDKVLDVVTFRYLHYWSHHFAAYMFCATDGMMIAHLALSLFVGSTVALAAKEREMVATVALGLVFFVLASVAYLMPVMVRAGGVSFPGMLGLQCADSLAMVAGGAFVRSRRQATASLPSST